MLGVMPDHDEVVEATAATEATMRPQSVPVNVYESPEALVVVAPFPAVVNTDANVELRDGVLRLSARLRSSGPREYLIREWEYGGYDREIAVPGRYAGGLEATLTNGQLAVRVLRGDSQPEASITPD